MQCTLSPGLTIRQRNGKFGDMVGNQICLKGRNVDMYKTDKDISFGYAKDKVAIRKAMEQKNSFENTAAKMIKMRQSLSKNDTGENDIQSFTKSMYQAPAFIKSSIAEKHDSDYYETFHAYSTVFNQRRCVRINSIETIILQVLGPDTPSWIPCKFVKLLQNYSNFGYVSWEDFRNIIPTAKHLVMTECDTTSNQNSITARLKSNDFTSEVNDLIEAFPESTHMTDYNANRFVDVDFSIDDPKKSGTTRYNFKGTSKGTEQTAGYCGHVPYNTANSVKRDHSCGLKPRPQTCDLRLVSERLGSVPGYTGHIPLHTGLNSDRTTGMDPRTTSGAAFGEYYSLRNKNVN